MAYYLQSSATTTGYIQMDNMSQGVGGGATRISWDIEFEAIRNGTDFIPVGRNVDSDLIIFLKSDDSFELRVRNQTFNVSAATMGIAGTNARHKYRLQHREINTTYETTLFVDDVQIVTWTLDGPDQYDVMFDRLFTLGNSTRHGGIWYYSYTDNITAANSRYYDADASGGTGTVLPETTPNGANGTQQGTWPGDNSEWVDDGTGSPSISAADNITSDAGTSTFTLINNVGNPTAARLNGTDLGTLTDLGGGVWQYNNPLLADDAAAALDVDVDSQTVGTTISYANSYPYVMSSHGVAEANSIMEGNQFASAQPVELKVITDFNAGVIVVDWAAMDTNQEWRTDIQSASSVSFVAEGSTTVTLGYFVRETGATGTFDATVVATDQLEPSVVSVSVPAGATYLNGATLSFTVNFDEAVTVTGNPYLAIDMGGEIKQAGYVSGSGSSALVFSYTIQSGDEDANGIILTTLELNGGTITDTAAVPNNAILTLNGVGDTSGVWVDSGPNDVVTFGTPTLNSNSVSQPFTYPGADVDSFEYSLDGGAWTTTTSPVQLFGLTPATGYTLEVRPVNASGPGVPTSTSFTTQASVDTTPDPFSFTALTNQALNTPVVSNSIIVQGVDAGQDIPISISGDASSEYAVSTDGGVTWGGYTSAPTNVRLNYRVRIRHTTSNEYSSGGYNGVRSSTLDIGGVTGTFTSTTLADTTNPVITLTGGNQQVEQGSAWTEPGYSATDNADGDLTGSVVVTGSVDTATLGTYTLTYSVTDASGNSAQTTRTVTVVVPGTLDTTKPVISLVGGNQTITEGDAWVEPGYTATDDVDGDVTADVVVTGTVNTAVPGQYTLTYSVTDAAGNTGTTTRTVTVQAIVTYPATNAAPAKRTYVAEATHRPELGDSVFTLKAGEILDFDFDLTAWLVDQNDTLQASGGFTVTVPENSIALRSSERITGLDRIKVWLDHNDAAPVTAYPVRLTITTTANRTAVFQFRVVALEPYQ